jgi:hypothetical protein
VAGGVGGAGAVDGGSGVNDAYEPEHDWPEIVQIMPAPGWYWGACWGSATDGLHIAWEPLVGWGIVRRYSGRTRTYTADVEALIYTTDGGVYPWSLYEELHAMSNEVAMVTCATDRAVLEGELRQQLTTRLADIAWREQRAIQ